MTLNEKLSWFDTYIWEPLKRRFPVLHTWDDTDPKTWVAHAAVTAAVAYGGGLLLWLTGSLLVSVMLGKLMLMSWWFFERGVILNAWAAVGFYVVREVSARMELGWDYKRLDFYGDILGPVIAASVLTWIHWA